MELEKKATYSVFELSPQEGHMVACIFLNDFSHNEEGCEYISSLFLSRFISVALLSLYPVSLFFSLIESSPILCVIT